MENYRKHYRQHTGEIPFVCTFKGCNYKAKHNNSLVYHTKKVYLIDNVDCIVLNPIYKLFYCISIIPLVLL